MLKIILDCQFGNFNLNLDQTLPSNRIVGLFGASGSGKSKFIRQLLGFDRHYQTTAQIRFNQQVWQAPKPSQFLSPVQREIGYLPQSLDLFPHLSVYNNLVFSLKLNTRLIDQQWVEQINKQLDIQDLLEKMPHQLSGGQKQRVALARAILTAKNILILDEPFSAIGETHKAQAMQLLKQVQQEKKISIIFSSHNRYEHSFLSDYLVTFNQGKIEQAGNYDKIATDIDGNFSQQIDAINHIQAEVEEFEAPYSVNRVKTKQHDLWVGQQALKKGSKVELEVKAQDISLFLSQKDKSSILNNLKVTVKDFKDISAHQSIVKLKFEDCFLIAFITKKSLTELALKKGQTLYAKFKSVSVTPISL